MLQLSENVRKKLDLGQREINDVGWLKRRKCRRNGRFLRQQIINSRVLPTVSFLKSPPSLAANKKERRRQKNLLLSLHNPELLLVVGAI